MSGIRVRVKVMVKFMVRFRVGVRFKPSKTFVLTGELDGQHSSDFLCVCSEYRLGGWIYRSLKYHTVFLNLKSNVEIV